MIDYILHPDWLALVCSICEEPASDLLRLVAADWLEENGDGERAEFIRLQVEQALLPDQSPDSPEWQALQDRIRPLLGDAPPGNYRPNFWKWFASDSPATGWQGPLVHRGFIRRVDLALPEYAARAGSLFRSHPITSVLLHGVRPHFVEGFSIWYPSGTIAVPDSAPQSAVLPVALFRKLGPFHERCMGFASERSALNAAFSACVTLGRETAELPPLPAPAEAVYP